MQSFALSLAHLVWFGESLFKHGTLADEMQADEVQADEMQADEMLMVEMIFKSELSFVIIRQFRLYNMVNAHNVRVINPKLLFWFFCHIGGRSRERYCCRICVVYYMQIGFSREVLFVESKAK